MDWDIFFRIFLTTKEIFFGYRELVNPNIFQDAVKKNMFILIQKFSDKFHKSPDFDTLYLLLDKLPVDEQENRSSYVAFIDKIKGMTFEVDTDAAHEQISKALHDYEIEQFILDIANKVGQITSEEVMENIRTINTKFSPKTAGIDVTDVVSGVKTIRQHHSDRISTGIHDLDLALMGGYGTDEITIVMAPPGKGKSFFLINAMYYSMLAGHDALYVTLELSEKAVLRRLYSRVACATKKELHDEAMIAKTVSQFFNLAKAKGRIMYFPGRSLTVAALEGVLERQELYFGWQPKILIVDYLDRMAPSKSDVRSDVRHQLRNITDDLRSISLRYAIPVLTASQANRASLSKIKMTEANMSEAWGKVEVADVIAALCQTDEEKAMNRARLTLIKNREYVSGNSMEFYMDLDRMFLCDLKRAHQMHLLDSAEPANIPFQDKEDKE